MTEQNLDNKTFSETRKVDSDVIEIDLMYIFRKIIAIRSKLYKAAGIGCIIGLIIALSIPKQYTVNVTLSPEMGTSKSGNGLAGLAASFLGSNATMAESMDALNASLSSDIVSSTPFLLELLQMKIQQTEKNTSVTLECYLDEESSPWWKYVLGFPGIIIRAVKSIFMGKDIHSNQSRDGIIELTKEIAQKIDYLRTIVNASVDKKTGITSVAVNLQNPQIAALVADSVVYKLQESIIDYRTTKAKEDCIYLEKLYNERQQEYYAAQRKYAKYVDSNDNLILQSVRTEQERLQNDMSLAYQIYSQVATQLQVARAKVQEVKPVFVVVEPAVVPQKSSSFGMKLYVLIFMFISMVFTIAWELIGKDFVESLRNVLRADS